jgi:hypothetical protein
VDFGDWYLGVLGLVGISLAAFFYGFNGRDVNRGLFIALPTLVFGLLGYNYYALLLPGVGTWREAIGEGWAAGLATWIAGLLGLGVGVMGLRAWGRWIRVPSRGRNYR